MQPIGGWLYLGAALEVDGQAERTGTMRIAWLSIMGILLVARGALCAEGPVAEPQLGRDVVPVIKARCIKCHGPAKREGKLDLSTPGGIARGGENGVAIVPGDAAASLMWQRIADDEMPPDEPLAADERAVLQRWILARAPGLPAAGDPAAGDHWAFRPLVHPPLPDVASPSRARTSVDRFVLAALEGQGLTLNGEADRATLVRRVSFDLTGLPPTPDEIATFVADTATDAYQRIVERYLASPHYGERWGKYWLDAGGYADSNGYFNADTDRPLAYRYRDYVVRSLNEDKPFDRFVQEQLAGDELAGFVPGQDATPEIITLLEATHFLRNGQDGTGESDGNPDEVRVDRYSALESTVQIVASSLLGLTVQCAKCHDHKFEPISQRDYYRLQSVFYPAFNVQDWLKPNERVVHANLPGEVARWEARGQKIDAEFARLKADFATWYRANRPPSAVLFRDDFDGDGPPLADNWSNTAPGDDTPGGAQPVQLDSDQAPGALRRAGTLQILESGGKGDRWLSTRLAFDWTPDGPGQWIQATFDLVDNKSLAGRGPAERIAYFIALHDFDGNGPVAGGNVLIDGNPAGGAAVHVAYPHAAKSVGNLGQARYEPGHNFGVRVTHVGDDKFRLEHLVDGIPDEKSLELKGSDLPDGGFGFEYCCGRSFVVDNVVVEHNAEGSASEESLKRAADALRAAQKQLAADLQAREAARGERPGKIAWVTDRSENPPDTFLLTRGNYAAPAEKVQPAPLGALNPTGEQSAALIIKTPFPGAKSTGRRLAWARWLTQAESRAAALLARVQVNRIWQHHFGAGLVATIDNLGISGASPSHAELLDYLAGQFVRDGWSQKALHRLLVNSAVYRQTSAVEPRAFARDPDNRLLWRYRLQRLDAEAMRDAMLAVGDQLDRAFAGPYVPTTRDDGGEVSVKQGAAGANRRAIYLQQRRTQTLSLLNLFDAPSMVYNCVERPVSTMPLQSLSLLNSEFVVARATELAARLAREAGAESPARVDRAFLLTLGRQPTQAETQTALEFVHSQREHYAARADGDHMAWVDFCQMLLASNAFLYLE